MPYRLLNGPSGRRQRSAPFMSYEINPKSAQNTYTLAPSVAGVGPAGPFLLSSFSSRGRGASRSHTMRPVSRSRQMVTRRLPRAAVRKMRSRLSAGDEWPNGNSVFQITLVAGPNSPGKRRLADTPDPLGPRKRPHSPGSGPSAARVDESRNTAVKTRVIVRDHSSVGWQPMVKVETGF